MRTYYAIVGLAAIAVMMCAVFVIHLPAWVSAPGAYCGGTLFASAFARRS